MNRLFVIAGLVILVIALVFLNQGIKKAGSADDDDTPPPTAAKPAPPAANTPAPAAITAPPSSAALPAEETLGNPATAKHQIQVGWSYTETNQQKPETLSAPVQAIAGLVQGSGGRLAAEVVDTDVPAEDRSPAARTVPGDGIYVDGKPVFSGDISGAPLPQVMGAVQAATK